MTLALYGKTRRRKSLLVLLALFAVLAATVSGAALRQSQLAQAASTASLLPIGDGGDSANWSAVPSGTAWSKVTEYASTD